MSRPTMKSVKDGMKALIVAALPQGVELVVIRTLDDFSEYATEKFPRLVGLGWNGGSEVSDNLAVGVGNATQQTTWSWVVDVRVGAPKSGNDLFDEAASLLDTLYDGLFGAYPATKAGPLLIQAEPEVVGTSNGIPVYRTVWMHEVGP